MNTFGVNWKEPQVFIQIFLEFKSMLQDTSYIAVWKFLYRRTGTMTLRGYLRLKSLPAMAKGQQVLHSEGYAVKRAIISTETRRFSASKNIII